MAMLPKWHKKCWDANFTLKNILIKKCFNYQGHVTAQAVSYYVSLQGLCSISDCPCVTWDGQNGIGADGSLTILVFYSQVSFQHYSTAEATEPKALQFHLMPTIFVVNQCEKEILCSDLWNFFLFKFSHTALYTKDQAVSAKEF
jgi:hypothetical protein